MQFSIHCRFLILPLIAIAVLITGCETSTNSIGNNGKEELTEELTFSPLPYESSKFLFNPEKSGTEAAKPLAESEPLYGCVLSTLNRPETEYAYSYHAYELSFPQKIVAKAQGKNHVRVFMLSNNKANATAGSFRGKENIVRMARCRIPAAEQADTMVDKALRNFSTGTWLDSAMNKTKTATKSKAAGGSYEWICTEYGSTTYYAYNEEHEEWEVLVIGSCTAGYYVFVEETGSPGGGGGSTGGLGDDPAPPCNDPTLPCIEGPGGGGIGIPQDEEEPCETGNAKIDDLEEDFFDLWKASDPYHEDISQRKEQGGWIVETANGYELQNFGTNFPVAACSITFPTTNIVNFNLPPNTVGMVHTHPYEMGEDIGAICGKDKKIGYKGIASIADIQLQRLLAINAVSNNYVDELVNFTGIVLDKDGIRVTSGELGVGDGTITQELIENNTNNEVPCGYK